MTEKQNCPLMDVVKEQGTLLFTVDLWEYAYSLRYRNHRGEFLSALWKIVDWVQVGAYDREAQESSG